MPRRVARCRASSHRPIADDDASAIVHEHRVVGVRIIGPYSSANEVRADLAARGYQICN
jgi:hypothetical protein